ncbi:MAG: glycosyltransferase family 4 protein [Candidatus Aegiribacteria sp.]|nr:glycosyltransferase family 4 protein [Candidatus Aegiribacteria sp.]
MRVGFDATNILGHGGIKTYARELIKALASEYPGDEFILYTTFSSSKKEKLLRLFEKYPNIEVCKGLPHARMLGDRLRWLSGILGALYWRILEHKLDLVHLTDPYSAAGYPGKFVATINDLFPLTRDEFSSSGLKRFYKRKTPQILHRTEAVITPSLYTADQIQRLYTNLTRLIYTVPDAADSTFQPLNRDDTVLSGYGLDRTRYFLFVGRVDSRKNLQRLIDAYSGLDIDTLDSGVHLVLVLSGQNSFEADFSEKKHLHVLRDVPQSDIIQFYSSADALVFPSLDEGFGLPVLEAMQCGCPVITSNCASLPEVAGDAAILVDPESVSEIRSAMRLLACSEEKREELRNQGFDQARSFSWEKTARMTMNVYSKVINAYLK